MLRCDSDFFFVSFVWEGHLSVFSSSFAWVGLRLY